MLDDWQYERLKAASEQEGRSLGSLIRDAITAFLHGRQTAGGIKLSDIAGIGDDHDARGRDHDDILYGPGRKD
jgi:hypothetical protein